MAEKKHLSMEDCIEASKILHQKIKEEYDLSGFKGLVAILNGGMFPAYWLRKLLRADGVACPLQMIDVQSYDENLNQGEIKILQKPDIAQDGAGWIFVDEIADTGATFVALKKLYPKALFVSLTAKPKGYREADINMLEMPQEQWVVFPWEIGNL